MLELGACKKRKARVEEREGGKVCEKERKHAWGEGRASE